MNTKQPRTLESLKNEILAYRGMTGTKADFHTWDEVGEHFGITKGLAWKIALEAYDPKDPHIRAGLNLPALAEAPVCLKCGEVHTTKRCTKRKPKAEQQTPIGVTEHDEQVVIFRWAALQACRYPDLELMFAIPNGGLRSKGTAARLKDEGVKSGVPDIFLPAARGGYHGLLIELKVGDNHPTDGQKWFIDYLNRNGFRAVVCWGADAAIAEIQAYLALSPNEANR